MSFLNPSFDLMLAYLIGCAYTQWNKKQTARIATSKGKRLREKTGNKIHHVNGME